MGYAAPPLLACFINKIPFHPLTRNQYFIDGNQNGVAQLGFPKLRGVSAQVLLVKNTNKGGEKSKWCGAIGFSQITGVSA
jgi:hypothetical protein